MSEREQNAVKTVKTFMLLSAGAGFIPIPWVDLTAVAAVQLKLLAELSKIYGVPFRKNCGKAAIASLIGFVLPHAMAFGAAGSLLKLIPVVGTLSGVAWMGLFSGAYTWALGNVFIQHFESGGTFLDFDAQKVKEHFLAQFEEGKKISASMDTKDKPVDSVDTKAT